MATRAALDSLPNLLLREVRRLAEQRAAYVAEIALIDRKVQLAAAFLESESDA